MRAVNLIPTDARSTGRPTAGRSGGAVYAVLGALVVLVAMVAMWATTSGRISEQKAELGKVQQDTAQVRARAAALQSPGVVQQDRVSRTELVKAIAAQRTDWAERLDAISRTLPSDVTLASLNATSAAGAAGADPAAAPGAPAEGATAELAGCAPSQRAVARLMPRLRSIPEVVGVTLLSSSMAAEGGQEQAAGAGTGAASCSGATFTMKLGYVSAPAAVATTAAPGAAPGAPGAAAPPAATTAVEGTPDPGTGGTQ